MTISSWTTVGARTRFRLVHSRGLLWCVPEGLGYAEDGQEHWDDGSARRAEKKKERTRR